MEGGEKSMKEGREGVKGKIEAEKRLADKVQFRRAEA